MQLTAKQLKNLPVYTKSQEFVGKIKEIEIDSNTHSVRRYLVKSTQVVKILAGEELLISPGQVVCLDEQKMIVEDALIKDNGFIKEPVVV